MNLISKLFRFRITSPLLSGMVQCCIWLCIGAVIVSLLISMTSMAEQSAATASFFVHAVACACGGFSSGRRSDQKGWYHGALIGLLYTVIIVLIGFLGFDAKIGFDTLGLLGLTMGTGMLGGMVGVNAQK